MFAASMAFSACEPAKTPTELEAAAISDPYRLRNLGKLHADRDSGEGYFDAVAYFRRLVELQPDDPADRLRLAKAMLFAEEPQRSGADAEGEESARARAAARTDEAKRQLEAARRLFGDEVPPDVDYVEGLIERRRQRYVEAAAAFRRVTEQRPRHGFAWFQRGRMNEEAGNLEEALNCYSRLVEIDATHRSGVYRLATLLTRLERKDEAKRAFDLFAKIPKSEHTENEKCDLTAITLRPSGGERDELPGAELRWADVTAKHFPHGAPEGVSRAFPLWLGSPKDVASLEAALLLIGPSVADRESGARILTHDGDRLAVAPTTDQLAGAIAGINDAAVCDLDGDRRHDVVLVSEAGIQVFRGAEPRGFELVEALAIERTPGTIEHVRPYDADHDGDLDLVVIVRRDGRAHASILRNNGVDDGVSFTELTPFEGLSIVSDPEVRRFSVDAHDVDQANDIDFVFAGGDPGVQAFLNKRGEGFERVALPELGRHDRVLVEDFDGDGAPDFFATGADPGWTIAMNSDQYGNPYRLRLDAPISERAPRSGAIHDAVLGDVDNDMDTDVVLATDSGIVILRNRSGGKLVEENAVPIASANESMAARTCEVVDLDLDGRLEIVATDSASRLVVLENETPGLSAGWTISPVGGRDNTDAVGTVVEQFRGNRYQSRMIRRAGGLHLGLAGERLDGVDGLRLRWPQGIVQAEPAQSIRRGTKGEKQPLFRFDQKAGLVSSCPFLYARGPSGFRFLTDVLGIAPLDEWLPEGGTPHYDPEEFVRVPGDALAAFDGHYEFALTEELRETAYLDRFELIVCDHPADRELYLDESTRQGVYEPLRLIVVRQEHLTPPTSIELEYGKATTDDVARIDGRYAHGYPRAPSQLAGWVEPFDVELETDSPARALLLTGRIAWYDSTVVYALSQNGREWGPYRLERIEEDGRTTTLVENLGFPAGMNRTIVAELPAGSVAAGTRLRLRGHHRFLWDRILFARDIERVEIEKREGEIDLARAGPAGPSSIRFQTVAVSDARLSFHGFSRTSGSRARHEQTYHYADAAPDDSFAPAVGRATRYGDVTPLLHEHDDRLVVVPAGDKVEIRVPAVDEPPATMRRTFFVRITGWAKEGSFHNPSGGRILPLPRKDMTRYPPGAEVADDPEYVEYLNAYQTRWIRRRSP